MNLNSDLMTDCKGKKFVVGTELIVPNTLLKITCIKIDGPIGTFNNKDGSSFKLSQDALNVSKWEAESLMEYIKRLSVKCDE